MNGTCHSIAAGPFYAKWEHGAMRVRLSEGMAAIRYQAKITFPSGKVVDCWHTDVYALQAGSWKAGLVSGNTVAARLGTFRQRTVRPNSSFIVDARKRTGAPFARAA